MCSKLTNSKIQTTQSSKFKTSNIESTQQFKISKSQTPPKAEIEKFKRSKLKEIRMPRFSRTRPSRVRFSVVLVIKLRLGSKTLTAKTRVHLRIEYSSHCRRKSRALQHFSEIKITALIGCLCNPLVPMLIHQKQNRHFRLTGALGRIAQMFPSCKKTTFRTTLSARQTKTQI